MSGLVRSVVEGTSLLVWGIRAWGVLGILVLVAGCAPVSARKTHVRSAEGKVIPAQIGAARESVAKPPALLEVAQATDSIGNEILRRLVPQEGKRPPIILIEEGHFTGQGIESTEKEEVLDRLRRELNRAANGRLTFVGRHYTDILQQEQELERQTGKVGQGGGLEPVDYRLTGSISASLSPAAQGMEPSSFYQVSLKMTKAAAEATGGESVWEGSYPIRRFAPLPEPARP